MPRKRLTAQGIAKLRPPTAGQVDYWDEGFPGFGIRVSYRGARTWVYHYKLGGKSHRMTLGTFLGSREEGEPRLGGSLTLSEARALYQKARDDVGQGRDPRNQKRPTTGSKKFGVLVRQWLDTSKQKERRTHTEVRRVVDKYLLPVWADRDVRDITGQDVLDITDAIAERGATMSRRVHARIHKFFNWCISRTILTANPAAGLEKHGDEVKRERVLDDGEIKALWELSETYAYPFGPAIQLLLLTGQRQAKIAEMRWSDLEGNAWRIRREEGEKGTPEKLTLPPLAMAVLERCPRIQGQDLIFSTNGKTPVSGWSKVKQHFDKALNFDTPWRWHDLRRTAATRMNELGIEPHIVESLLGHRLPGVAGIYNQAKYDEPKRIALERWADKIQELVERRKHDNVVLLSK